MNDFEPVFCRSCHQQTDPETTFEGICPTCCVSKLKERKSLKKDKQKTAPKKAADPISVKRIIGGSLLGAGIIALALFLQMDISIATEASGIFDGDRIVNMGLMQQQLLGVLVSLFASHAGLTLCLEK